MSRRLQGSSDFPAQEWREPHASALPEEVASCEVLAEISDLRVVTV